MTSIYALHGLDEPTPLRWLTVLFPKVVALLWKFSVRHTPSDEALVVAKALSWSGAFSDEDFSNIVTLLSRDSFFCVFTDSDCALFIKTNTVGPTLAARLYTKQPCQQNSIYTNIYGSNKFFLI